MNEPTSALAQRLRMVSTYGTNHLEMERRFDCVLAPIVQALRDGLAELREYEDSSVTTRDIRAVLANTLLRLEGPA